MPPTANLALAITIMIIIIIIIITIISFIYVNCFILVVKITAAKNTASWSGAKL